MPIHYREYGTDNQALMLFLHGGGVSGWMWERQAEYFSRDYHCIIPDLPGHGSSPPQAGRFSMHDCAVSIIELIRAKAEDKPVTLIGFSLGAQVIVQLLSLEPGLAHAAIINSALTVPSPSMIRWIRPSVRLTFPLIQNRTFAKLQARTLYIPPDHFEQYYEESRQIQLDTLVHILEANMSFSIPDRFRVASARMLVTVGAKEKAMMRQSAAELVRSNPNVQGIMIPHIGHGMSLAQPHAFNKLISDWLHSRTLPQDCITIQ